MLEDTDKLWCCWSFKFIILIGYLTSSTKFSRSFQSTNAISRQAWYWKSSSSLVVPPHAITKHIWQLFYGHKCLSYGQCINEHSMKISVVLKTEPYKIKQMSEQPQFGGWVWKCHPSQPPKISSQEVDLRNYHFWQWSDCHLL